MKKIAINILSIGVLALSFTSCDDAKNDVIDNRVYIQEAVATPFNDIVMGDEGTVMSAPITIRLARALSHDVTVKVALNQDNLDAYNKRNQTTYEMIPAEYVEFPSEVVVKAGEVSTTVPVQVTAFKGEGGVDYALSIGIIATDGLDASTGSSAYIYALSAPLKQVVPSFRYDNAARVMPESDWGYDLTNYTLEWWSRVTGRYNESGGYSVNNQAIFDSRQDGTNLYVRFGDLVYSAGGRYDNRFLQVKTFGGQFDTGDPTKGNELVSGTWYHFAVTYDAATGTSTMYKNGAKVSSLNTAAGVPLHMDKLYMFDSSSQYFRDNVEMAQVRLWKVTRTPDQIANFMRKEVKYNDPNLIFYLPMNDGEGATELKDVTGNGHDLKIGGGSNGTRNTAYAWKEYDFSSL